MLTGKEQIGCYFSMLYRLISDGKVNQDQKKFILSGLDRGIENFNQEMKDESRKHQLELAL